MACTDFLNKLIKSVNETAPSKEIRIKDNTQEWFDRGIDSCLGEIVFKFWKFEASHWWEKLQRTYVSSSKSYQEKIKRVLWN